LLYVGVTRARDYLIFPSRKNPTKWLNRTWHNAAETPTLDPENQETIWEWDNKFLPIESNIYAYPKEIAMFDLQDADFEYFSERNGREEHLPYHVNLESENYGEDHNFRVISSHHYAKPVVLSFEHNPALFAKALCLFHTSFSTQLSDSAQINILTNIFKRMGFEKIDPKPQQERILAFEVHLMKNTRLSNIKKQYPILVEEDNRRFQSSIDFLAETPQGLLIVQHDSFIGERVKEKAQSYADWAFWVEKSLLKTFTQVKKITFVIHFPYSGTTVELV
jgi:hypothetical protein